MSTFSNAQVGFAPTTGVAQTQRPKMPEGVTPRVLTGRGGSGIKPVCTFNEKTRELTITLKLPEQHLGKPFQLKTGEWVTAMEFGLVWQSDIACPGIDIRLLNGRIALSPAL